MATVTGLTAARMLAIEAASVVSGVIDNTGHLILTTHDGTQIDAGSMAGKGVQYVVGVSESDLPTAYPEGISLLVLQSGSGWTLNGGIGSVVTYKFSDDRYQQIFFANAGGYSPVYEWTRAYDTTVGDGGWTPWQQTNVTNIIADQDNFFQTDDISYYPLGDSRMFYTPTNGSSNWDFSNEYGEIRTYNNPTADFAKQTWTKAPGGLTGNGVEEWVRTYRTEVGWTEWAKFNEDTDWVNLTLAAGCTPLSNGDGIQYRVRNGVVYINGGCQATFGKGTYLDVVSAGGLPVGSRPAKSHRGGALGTGLRAGGSQVQPDGSIQLGHYLDSPPTWMALNVSYPVEK